MSWFRFLLETLNTEIDLATDKHLYVPVCTPCNCPLTASRRCRRCWGGPGAATSGCRRTSWRRWSDRRWSSPTPCRAPCYSGTLFGERTREEEGDGESWVFTVHSLMWLYGCDGKLDVRKKDRGKKGRQEILNRNWNIFFKETQREHLSAVMQSLKTETKR